MSRLDAHQHFWRYNATDYVWMTGELTRLAQDFLPEQLRLYLDGAGFEGTVAVQARQMTAETEFLLELSKKHPWIYGVVGWVDFESDTLEEQLDGFCRFSKFKGVRELIHDMPDLNYASSPVHSNAIALLAERELTYDLLLRPQHIPATLNLVDRYPRQPFVVDHIGKPDIKAGMMEPWLSGIRELARRDNVYCKISGMVTEADWEAWQPAEIHPYLDVVLESFGPDRMMIGSDWPVCTCAGQYVEVMRVVIDYIDDLSGTEKDLILGDVCKSFYRLEID